MSLGLLAKDSMQDLASLADASSSNSIGSTVSEKSNSQTKKQNPAAPSKPQTPTSSPPTGRYSGFSSAYHDQNYYADHAYYDALQTNGSQELIQKPPNGFWQSLLPCLFPWTAEQHSGSRSNFLTQDSLDYSVAETEKENEKNIVRTPSTENDDISIGTTGSDAFGEKLSSKERQAVLARLGLAQPDTPPTSKDSTPISNDSSESSSSEKRRGLLSDLPHCDPLQQPSEAEAKPLKGILKRAVPKQPEGPEDDSISSNKNPDRRNSQSQGTRRSLFPQVSYEFTSDQKKSKKSVAFAPMARVVTVKSKNEMNSIEKGRIWWQKADYDDFRKTGRIITKAMMEGGTELWLNSARASYKTNGGEAKTNQETGDMITATGDKWWHKFGHSRRGLEHVVSMEEGRQRQLNVRTAIRSVLDEQTRQQLYNRVDAEKLRMVSLNYTSWARDLALASGASDADAVKSSFSEERKSREFYLLKLARNVGKTTSTSRHVPQFMQPALGIKPAQVATPLKLDQHTNTQIRFRMQSQLVDRPKAVVNGGNKATNNKISTPTSPTSTATCEPIHDHSSAGSGEAGSEERKDEQSMAQRAAGFTAKNSEKVDMAAVLSGMGAVPQSSHVVSTA